MSGPSASSSSVRISLLYLWVVWLQTSPLPAAQSDARFQWDEATGLTFQVTGTWGVQGYQVQAWDAAGRDRRPIATEARESPVKVRVHRLSAPVETDKLRIVITRVAPLDGQTRLLQLEAWGDSQ